MFRGGTGGSLDRYWFPGLTGQQWSPLPSSQVAGLPLPSYICRQCCTFAVAVGTHRDLDQRRPLPLNCPAGAYLPLVEALHTFKCFLNPDSEPGLVRRLGSCGGQGGADWFLLSESSREKSDRSTPPTLMYMPVRASVCSSVKWG